MLIGAIVCRAEECLHTKWEWTENEGGNKELKELM